MNSYKTKYTFTKKKSTSKPTGKKSKRKSTKTNGTNVRLERPQCYT